MEKDVIKLVAIIMLLISIALPISFSSQPKKYCMYIFGVMQEEGGIVSGFPAEACIRIINGSGKVYLLTSPLVEIDTQATALIAKNVACKFLGYDCSNLDFLYEIRSDYPHIGGPSGSAALALLTVSALLDKPVSKEVSITGMILPDGVIGPVGGIYYKADAARKKGIKIFMIPKGERLVPYEEVKRSQIGPVYQEIREIKTIDIIDYARENWNMTILEVNSIEDVVKYALGIKVEKKVDEEKISQMKNLYKELMKETCEYFENIIEENVKDAQDAKKRRNYYVCASLYYAYYINKTKEEIVRKLEEEGYNALYYIKEYIDNLRKNYTEKEDIIRDLKDVINNSISLELYSIMLDRLIEGYNLIDEAYTIAIKDGLTKELIEKVAMAKVRLISVDIWYKVFNKSLELGKYPAYLTEDERIRNIVEGELRYIKTIVAYIGSEFKGDFSEIEKKMSKIEELFYRKDYFPAYISIKELDSLISTSLDMLRGEDLTDVLNTIIQDVDYRIKLEESKGFLPLLAEAYLEYAKYYKEKDPKLSLYYAEYARNVLDFSSEFLNKTVVEEIKIYGEETPIVIYKERSLSEDISIAILLAVIAILLIGLMKK